VTVLTSKSPSPGNMFLATWSVLGDTDANYLEIVSNDGTPIFTRRCSAPAFDFKVQPTGVLTIMMGWLDTFRYWIAVIT